MRESAAGAKKDLACRRVGLLLWGLPFVALVATALVAVAPITRGAVWGLALLTAGSACIANACRSGRVHCYITGPFFVILAAAPLLHGLGILPLGPHGWLWIGAALVTCTPLLTVLPERIWGKTRHRLDQDRRPDRHRRLLVGDGL